MKERDPRHDCAESLTGKCRWAAFHLTCVLAVTVFGFQPAMGSTAYGDLNNFDVFNDTGQPCYGFEIELDDIHSTDITYTYDWNHYGAPTITEDNSDPAHPKVFVRYAAKYNPATGSFTAFTSIPASPPAPTQGHQCTDPSVNIGCEHCGVGHYGVPTVVRYHWLVEDPMNPGTLIRGPAVNVAAPNWVYYPPAPAQPAQVQAVILAPPPPPAPVYEFGDAVWVKAIVTTSHNNAPIALRDLVSDDPNDPNDTNWAHGEPDQVEVEWQIMQMDFNNPAGANNDLVGGMEALPNGDEVITRRYEFYEYLGPFDTETHEALCTKYPAIADPADPNYRAACDPATVTILGDYIGAQMAGFDVAAPLGLVDHIPDGDITSPYPSRRLVVGGNTPYATQVTLGALPDGLTIDSATGILSGTVSTIGYYPFTVDVTDANNVQASKAYTMVVGPLPLGVPERSGEELQFAPPWPNPAARTMHLEFHLRERGPVTADVVDIGGRHVSSLLRGEVLPPGIHRLQWDGRDASGDIVTPGIYMIRVTSGSWTAARRVAWIE